MKWIHVSVLALVFTAAAAGQQAIQPGPLPVDPLPEVPVIQRDVALIVSSPQPHYTQPVIPAFRTSNDGRVALSLKKIAGKMGFFLNSPEKLSQPFLLSGAGAEILASTTPYLGGLNQQLFYDSNASAIPGGQIVHSTLCDGSSQFPARGETASPYPCGTDGAHDCYDLTVVAAFWDTSSGCSGPSCALLEIWGTPVTVEVTQPKTASAAIFDVRPGPPVLGPTYVVGSFFEPVTTGDGRLFVGRIGNSQITWTDPGGNPVTGSYDIVYSVYPESAPPCDVTRWTELRPVSHAPHDPEVQGRYGIAEYPLRDPEGFEIPDGVDLKGTYPWIDRAGNNLFFTTVPATLFYWDPNAGEVRSRYPADCVAGVT